MTAVTYIGEYPSVVSGEGVVFENGVAVEVDDVTPYKDRADFKVARTPKPKAE